MNKQEVYDYLNQNNIEYELTEHEAVFSMEELQNVVVLYPEYDAKNLFIRDDKKKIYFLITVRGAKRVDLKEFRKIHGLKGLSFASAEDLKEIMNLIPGSVSPFGLLNDKENKVHFYLDKEFLDGKKLIGIHPNDNTATVWLHTEDLIKIIESHGNKVELVNL